MSPKDHLGAAQGEHQGPGLALQTVLPVDALHDGPPQLPGHHNGDDLLFRLAGDPLQLLKGLLPYPAAPDDGAAPGAVAAGGVHNHVGVALVHGDQDQAILVGGLGHILTLLFRQPGAGVDDGGHKAAHRRKRGGEGNAPAGHAAPQIVVQSLQEGSGGGNGGKAQNNILLRAAQAQNVQNLRGGGAGTLAAQVGEHLMAGVELRELVAAAPLDDGHDEGQLCLMFHGFPPQS